MTHDLRRPWHRETIGHTGLAPIVNKIDFSLAVPPAPGVAPSTDATWIYDAEDYIVCFVGNGPRQTENGDLIAALPDLLDLLRGIQRDWHDMKHSGEVTTCVRGHCFRINKLLEEKP